MRVWYASLLFMADSTPNASTDATKLQKHRQTFHLQKINNTCLIVQISHRPRSCPDHFVVSALLSRLAVQRALQANQMSHPSVAWEAHAGVARHAVRPD